jgi:hypothetical protein
LEPYRPTHLGLDLEKFFAEMAACFAQVLASNDPHRPIEIDPELIPEIHLTNSE